MNYRICVISTARPHTVKNFNEIIGSLAKIAHWYVKPGEKETYEKAGAKYVVEVEGGLMGARNRALDDAFEKDECCVQISDDIEGLYTVARQCGKNVRRQTDLATIINAIDAHMFNFPQAHLFGFPPTANPFYSSGRFLFNKFIVGDLFIVKPSKLRFDPRLTLKEDYDYCLQHTREHGITVRCEMFLAEFAHRTNKGGAVDYRTPEEEQKNIAYLKKKWGKVIKDNPRRDNEILLKI